MNTCPGGGLRVDSDTLAKLRPRIESELIDEIALHVQCFWAASEWISATTSLDWALYYIVLQITINPARVFYLLAILVTIEPAPIRSDGTLSNILRPGVRVQRRGGVVRFGVLHGVSLRQCGQGDSGQTIHFGG